MFNRIIQFISFFFFGLALWLIIKEVEKVGLEKVWQLMSSTPLWVLLIAGFFVIADYVALACYDVLSLDYIRYKLPFRTVFKTSAIGFAVSNTVGHAFISGGAVRYLFYTPLGLSRAQVLLLIAFETLTLFMGMGVIYVIATLLLPFTPSLTDQSHLITYYGISFLIVCAFSVYWFWVIKSKRAFKISGVTLKAPSEKLTGVQLLLGFADNFLVSLVFYSVLRYHLETPFLPVFIVYTIAQITALVSQVPGGLGVFTSLFLLLFPHALAEKGAVLASLFVYRVLYFIIPFLSALIYLGIYLLKTHFLKGKTKTVQHIQ